MINSLDFKTLNLRTMKKSSLVLCITLIMGFIMPFNAMGIDDGVESSTLTLSITPTAQISIVTNPTFNMALGGATQAGAAVSSSSINATSRLRISSLVDQTPLNIKAQIGAPITDTHTELLVQLGTPNGNFVNILNKGDLATVQNLTSGASVTLATGISTCWSGITEDDGYPITYTFQRLAGETIFSSPGPVVVTYTLSSVL